MWEEIKARASGAGTGLVALFAFAAVAAMPNPAHAERYPLAPQTKVRVNVVQWIPSKGEYQRWEAVGGEFVVSDEGTISLPLVGRIEVNNLDNTELAAKISDELKSKTGLISPPDATVEILEYPPFYIVGSVAAPGEYKFRPGLTVLQALALSGGRQKAPTEGGANGQVGMLGDLQGVRDDILRGQGRIARLQAERAGEKTIRFPGELMSSSDKDAAEIMEQEKIIFEARSKGLERQLDSLAELRNLFTSEIEILGEKTDTLNRSIKLAEEELAGVKSLVERGIATVSRRSDLERAVANLHSNRLDEITATMRARQNLSEATRSALNLRDKHQTDVSTELQDAQANIERLRIKENVIKQVLVLGDVPITSERRSDRRGEASLSYVIVRQSQGKTDEFAASEASNLMPGDVVKVAISDPSMRSSALTAGGATAQ